MKYKIEIWRYHSIAEDFINDDINEILEWYKENWLNIYDNGGCTFYVFKNDSEVEYDELYDLGFYD